MSDHISRAVSDLAETIAESLAELDELDGNCPHEDDFVCWQCRRGERKIIIENALRTFVDKLHFESTTEAARKALRVGYLMAVTRIERYQGAPPGVIRGLLEILVKELPEDEAKKDALPPE